MADDSYDPYADYNIHQNMSPSAADADPSPPGLHLNDVQGDYPITRPVFHLS